MESNICCQIAVKTIKAINTNKLKSLAEALELEWGASILFGMPKGGDERTGFLRALMVFGWVPLACGCILSIPVCSGCVSVLLHLLLHAF